MGVWISISGSQGPNRRKFRSDLRMLKYNSLCFGYETNYFRLHFKDQFYIIGLKFQKLVKIGNQLECFNGLYARDLTSRLKFVCWWFLLLNISTAPCGVHTVNVYLFKKNSKKINFCSGRYIIYCNINSNFCAAIKGHFLNF